MDEEPEETEGNGIIKHDNIKELVNRYVAAVKLFDEQCNADRHACKRYG